MVLLQNVSKLYKLYKHPSDRLREVLPFAPAALHSDFWALRDISFQVEKGETLGLVGPNGCGKSTLLQIVCGILQPTQGRVVTRGRALSARKPQFWQVTTRSVPSCVQRSTTAPRPTRASDMRLYDDIPGP